MANPVLHRSPRRPARTTLSRLLAAVVILAQLLPAIPAVAAPLPAAPEAPPAWRCKSPLALTVTASPAAGTQVTVTDRIEYVLEVRYNDSRSLMVGPRDALITQFMAIVMGGEQ